MQFILCKHTKHLWSTLFSCFPSITDLIIDISNSGNYLYSCQCIFKTKGVLPLWIFLFFYLKFVCSSSNVFIHLLSLPSVWIPDPYLIANVVHAVVIRTIDTLIKLSHQTAMKATSRDHNLLICSNPVRTTSWLQKLILSFLLYGNHLLTFVVKSLTFYTNRWWVRTEHGSVLFIKPIWISLL